MCTRIFYKTAAGTYITGRSMDWSDETANTALWIFPKGMKRNGGVGTKSIEWVSKYGSVIVSFYALATSDGMNESGLVGNLLYLAEAGYLSPSSMAKPIISVGAWLQYMLDNYGSVAEAVQAMRTDPFRIISADAPNGRPASVHLCLSDSTGDSAIFEYIDGALQIHHGSEFTVMTNSPVYDQQLALNTYWELIGGKNMLPGTISAADRFVRASYYLKSSPKFQERKKSVAAVFSQIRSIGVPLGMSDPDKPNISSTLWRTVSDHQAKRYYFDSVVDPAVFWVDLDSVDLSPGAKIMKLEIVGSGLLEGDVSKKFTPSEPFAFLAPTVI